VAVCTCHGRVLPGQGETRVVVVKGRRAPGRRTVADIALLREANRRVVWVVRVLKIFQMTARAGRVCNVVVRIDVTLAALQSRVSPRQRPAGRCVIERCRVPVRGRMADLALLREAGRRVVRVVRVLEIFQMAADASRGGQVVVSIRVALCTRHTNMRSSEREAGLGVIERSGLPR
jgi:hypothetical protein